MFNTQVSDISPLKGMPLTDLLIQGTRVSDLAPLRGMQLRSFTATSSPIADLSPLEGAPLSNVSISKTKITNLAPLKDAPLVSIYFTPAAITNGIEHLRANRKLQRINGMSALAFWQKYDSVESKAKAEQSTESDGLKPAP